MIAGALEIIGGVDAGVVNPLLLPAAQGEGSYAYIVITYDDFPGVLDILFVQGTRVAEYASLHHELRAILGVQSVEMLLKACNRRCQVYLFSVSREGFERFLRTFYFEPTFNMVIDRLSRKQISGMLMDSGCRNGILEVDCAGVPLPKIELARFHSEEELLREASRFRRGRLSLFDLELNSAIRQKMAALQGGVPERQVDLDDADPPRNDPPGGKTGHTVDPDKPDPPGDAAPGGNPAGEVGADTPDPPKDPPAEGARDEMDPAPDPAGDALPGIDGGAITPAGGGCGEAEYAALFRNVLEEFAARVKEVYKRSQDEKMNDFLCVQFNCPGEFDPAIIDSSNAINVITVIDEMCRGWSLKRNRLRKFALDILKNLYEENTGMLRSHRVDARVHKCFTDMEANLHRFTIRKSK